MQNLDSGQAITKILSRTRDGMTAYLRRSEQTLEEQSIAWLGETPLNSPPGTL